MEHQNDKLQELSRTAAMTFVLARAFNLWNQRLERLARELKQEHTQRTKMALSDIERGAQMASRGLRHFEDWALEAGETESGHHGDFETAESYMTDGAWVAYLAGATFNATSYDPTIRLKVETICKNATKGQPLINWDILNNLRPKL